MPLHRSHTEDAGNDPTGYHPSPRTARDEGSERRLAVWAAVYQAVGWVFTVPGIILLALGVKDILTILSGGLVDASPFSSLQLVGGVGLLSVGGSALFFSALLHGAADVVRLLKRTNNLPYSGEILL